MINKEEIIAFLKENLTIHIENNHSGGYSRGERIIDVTLKIGEEQITTTYFCINECTHRD